VSDGRNRDDQNESGAQPSDAISYLGYARLANKVDEQNDAGECENNAQGCEPFMTGGFGLFVHFIKAGSR
jgi:hypothetical protein